MSTYLVYLVVLVIFCVYRCTSKCSTTRSSFGPLTVKTHCIWSRLSSVPYNIDAETTKLNLGSNVITSISGYDWSKLPALEELNLNSNNFATMRGTSWSGLTSLKTLLIESNLLTSLNGANWSGLENLLELKLYNNKISSLVGVSWEGLTSLKELDLRKNKLTTVKDVDWSQLTALRILNFGYNSIDLSDATWYGLQSLKELSLHDNGIYSLDDAKWYGLSSVDRLSLTLNHISSFVNANWCGLLSLRKLFLLKTPVGESCSPSLCVPKTLYDYITVYSDMVPLDPGRCIIEKCKVMKPVFNVRAPGFIELKEGQSENFTMGAIGIPEDIVYSFKKDRSPHVVMDGEMLQISNVRSTDRGSYVVKAENSEGLTMHSFTLNVKFKPVFDKKMPKEIQINEGKSDSVNFSAEANPLPIFYTLYKDGKQFKQRQIVIDNGMLKMYSITRKYSGSYVLKAENSEGSTKYSVEVVVRVIPQFNVNVAKQIVIKEGRSETFNMSASGISQNISYKLQNQEGKITSARVVMNNGMLALKEITGKEHGSYMLIAKNTAGSTFHHFTITVKLKPIFRKNITRQLGVIEGQSQIFNMSALGDGIVYTLYKDGMRTNTTHIDIKRGGIIEVKGIDKSDAGVYMLQAQNDVGITTFNFTVSVSDYTGNEFNTIYYVIIAVIVVILLVVIIVTCVICKRRRKREKLSMTHHAEAMQKLNTERT